MNAGLLGGSDILSDVTLILFLDTFTGYEGGTRVQDEEMLLTNAVSIAKYN